MINFNDFLVIAALIAVLSAAGTAFLLYHAHKQEREYKARTNQK